MTWADMIRFQQLPSKDFAGTFCVHASKWHTGLPWLPGCENANRNARQRWHLLRILFRNIHLTFFIFNPYNVFMKWRSVQICIINCEVNHLIFYLEYFGCLKFKPTTKKVPSFECRWWSLSNRQSIAPTTAEEHLLNVNYCISFLFFFALNISGWYRQPWWVHDTFY